METNVAIQQPLCEDGLRVLNSKVCLPTSSTLSTQATKHRYTHNQANGITQSHFTCFILYTEPRSPAVNDASA